MSIEHDKQWKDLQELRRIYVLKDARTPSKSFTVHWLQLERVLDVGATPARGGRRGRTRGGWHFGRNSIDTLICQHFTNDAVNPDPVRALPLNQE